jgi:hypothetical protein
VNHRRDYSEIVKTMVKFIIKIRVNSTNDESRWSLLFALDIILFLPVLIVYRLIKMNLSLSLDAKEVLFHLNYMGYRNISKEQLKYFMFGENLFIVYLQQF